MLKGHCLANSKTLKVLTLQVLNMPPLCTRAHGQHLYVCDPQQFCDSVPSPCDDPITFQLDHHYKPFTLELYGVSLKAQLNVKTNLKTTYLLGMIIYVYCV